jgi:DNA-directed RNA polymerase specialized sigma subunit, sigma24 homolog
MEVYLKINGQAISVEVTFEVSEYLDQANHKTENLAHEKRRHWDDREYDEAIIFHGCSRSLYVTPEQWLIRKETLREIAEALESCTEVQRQRFLLYALEGLSFAEIAKRCGCSKGAVQGSIEAVRKKCRGFFENRPYET